jgi:hypothetical protein
VKYRIIPITVHSSKEKYTLQRLQDYILTRLTRLNKKRKKERRESKEEINKITEKKLKKS